ncbi:MAG: hypothetical protein HOV67_10060, partial [Kribbellaceae bacterium]|nr:hypothetical protein [Kribbellaceae bacterium]
ATDAGTLSVDEARAAFSSATIGILGQLAATDLGAGDAILQAICEHADLYGGFDGTEGIAASAYLSSAQRADRPSDAAFYYEYLTSSLGMPDQSGGGYETSPVFDQVSGSLGLPSAAEMQQIRELMSSGQDLLPQVAGLAHKGYAGGGRGAPASGNPMYDLGRGVGDSATGTALATSTGRAVERVADGAGDLLEGLGDLFSGLGQLLGGIGTFFANIFSGDSQETKEQREQTVKEAPMGQCVAVTQQINIEVKDHGTVNLYVGADGKVQNAPDQAKPAENPPAQNKGPNSREDRCPVADDTISPDFSVPFWKDQAVLAPTANTVGPGVDGLVTAAAVDGRWQGLQLQAIAQVDDLGLLNESGPLGVLEDHYRVGATVRTPPRTRSEIVDAISSWETVITKATPANGSRRAAIVDIAALVQQLARAGLRPDDRAAQAIVQLARRAAPAGAPRLAARSTLRRRSTW